MSIKIRKYHQADLQECASVFYEVFGPNGCGESWTLETSLKHIQENTQSAEYCFVAVEDQNIVGLVLAMPVSREMNTDIFLGTLGVLSSVQGKNIGSSLLGKVKTLGKANGAKFVRLMANPKLLSYDWYSHKGMKPSGWVELEQEI